jgi:hypothetical protein
MTTNIASNSPSLFSKITVLLKLREDFKPDLQKCDSGTAQAM